MDSSPSKNKRPREEVVVDNTNGPETKMAKMSPTSDERFAAMESRMKLYFEGLTAEVRSLTATVKIQTAEIEQLKTENDQLKTENKQLKAKVESQSKEIDQLKAKVESQTSEIKQLKAKVESQTAEIEQLKAKVKNLVDELTQVKDDYSDLKHEVRTIQTELVGLAVAGLTAEELERRICQLNGRVDEYHRAVEEERELRENPNVSLEGDEWGSPL